MTHRLTRFVLLRQPVRVFRVSRFRNSPIIPAITIRVRNISFQKIPNALQPTRTTRQLTPIQKPIQIMSKRNLSDGELFLLLTLGLVACIVEFIIEYWYVFVIIFVVIPGGLFYTGYSFGKNKKQKEKGKDK